MSAIEFRTIPDFDPFIPRVTQLVESTGAGLVGDLGGGANPILSPEAIAEHGLDYTIYDASEEELGKAGEGYKKAVADVTSDGFRPTHPLDLVLSRWLLEHLADPEQFHRVIHRSLRDGGRALHAFPTLYSVPFLANLALPDAVGNRLLPALFPNRRAGGSHGKFPAHYRWCRGPTRRQQRRFERLGFEVEEYVGYFGHRYYERWPRLQGVEDRWAAFLVEHPVPLLTSYAWVVLRKVTAGPDGERS